MSQDSVAASVLTVCAAPRQGKAALVSTSFDAEDASKDEQLLRSLGWNVAARGENVFGSRLLERSRDDESRIIRCNAILLHSTC